MLLRWARLNCLPQHKAEREAGSSLRHMEGTREDSLKHTKRPPKGHQRHQVTASFPATPPLPVVITLPQLFGTQSSEGCSSYLALPPVLCQIPSQIGSFVSVPTANFRPSPGRSLSVFLEGVFLPSNLSVILSTRRCSAPGIRQIQISHKQNRAPDGT